MMLKRTLHSLLIVSFIVAFASMSFAADRIIVQGKAGLPRCVDQSSTVTANIDVPISALEVVLNVSNTTIGGVSVVWNLPADTLTDRVIDLTQYPLIRFAAMSTNPATENYKAGTGKPVATINFHTADVCAGTDTIAGAVWPSDPPFGTIQTQFVIAATGDLVTVPVDAGIISVTNQLPTIAAVVNPGEVLFGQLWTTNLSSTDLDMLNGCETMTYFVSSGPAGMTVAGNVLNWTPTGAQVCYDGDVIIGVKDKCNAQSLAAAFKICVTNHAPVFTVVPPALTEIAWGQTFTFNHLTAVDPDPGPYGPLYHLLSFNGPGTVNVDANTGVVTWVTLYEPAYTGLFTVTVTVDDGTTVCTPCAPENTDTASFQIRVVPFQLTIEKVEGAYLGQPTTVSVTMLDHTYVNKDIGGFDFLIQYDNSAMVFQFAEEGEFITDCEWEYFTYRYGANGNCGVGACPNGVLRVVAMGETNGGNLAHHPSCWTNTGGASNELVKLHFLLSNDANLECQFAPIRFVWYDCGDNGISSKEGDFLFMSQVVYDFAGFDELGAPIFNPITGLDPTMPTLTGAPAPECDVFTQKGHPWRLVHYYNGGVDIICADSIDAVGDINLNSIAYEIADAVMFTNYFVSGLSAFDNVDGSIAASDTNKDGITLSVADLVYLIRVVIGDALPYAKVTPVAARVTVGNGVYSVDQSLGAAYVVVSGNVTPSLLASGMEMKYAFNGQNTNILVYSLQGNSFSGNFLEADGDLVSYELATFNGQPVNADVMPANFELHQNYPNPFNPTTTIKIDVPVKGIEWKLNIYNVTGQLVQNFSGVSQGYDKVVWDAANVSSGVYFYKLTAGDYSSTKKAVLLK